MGCGGSKPKPLPLKPPESAKVVILGDSGVGKSSLVYRFTRHEFKDSWNVNIGANVEETKIDVGNNESVSLFVWDTAGQERFRSITRIYYQGARAAAIVYDITINKSFESCGYWVKELQNNEPGCLLFLVGNKIDKEPRVVNQQEAKEFADEHGMEFIETSAKSAENVDALFRQIAIGIKNSQSRK
ncbi:unnamed protein product [Blepharisma stoltei]|uniref:Uncharacterized protein n=1 Tax=Blepharisma stoltei TaxID=1481888 RepID=A0AAU9JK19_9CILI|nr:unnamed protein product [Blepharisma stoltei]